MLLCAWLYARPSHTICTCNSILHTSRPFLVTLLCAMCYHVFVTCTCTWGIYQCHYSTTRFVENVSVHPNTGKNHAWMTILQHLNQTPLLKLPTRTKRRTAKKPLPTIESSYNETPNQISTSKHWIYANYEEQHSFFCKIAAWQKK